MSLPAIPPKPLYLIGASSSFQMCNSIKRGKLAIEVYSKFTTQLPHKEYFLVSRESDLLSIQATNEKLNQISVHRILTRANEQSELRSFQSLRIVYYYLLLSILIVRSNSKCERAMHYIHGQGPVSDVLVSTRCNNKFYSNEKFPGKKKKKRYVCIHLSLIFVQFDWICLAWTN